MPARGAKERRAAQVYRGFLCAYPAAFRDEYARELCLAFVDRYREARSPVDALLLWAEAVTGILREAPKEHLQMILQDLRYAIRVLKKDSAVSAAAIAILALGIGSTTLVFSLANGLLLRPLPYPHAERIMAVEEYSLTDPNEQGNVNIANYGDFRARTQLLADIGVWDAGNATIIGQGSAEYVSVAAVADGVFTALGVAPIMGRTLTRADCIPHGPKVAVISEEFWERHYARDMAVVGKALDTANSRYAVVGVMPAGFHFPSRADAWFPIQTDTAKASRTDYTLGAVARLKPGVSREQAGAELQSMLEQIHREHPEANNGWRARATPLRDSLTSEYSKAVTTLLVAVAFLLLIACANVSNLLLVKASARGREMAVRAAIGATRSRLVRQLTAESLVLGIAGGAVGVALAYVGTPALLSLIPVELPRWMDFSVDYRVLAFGLAVSLLTAMLAGIAPVAGATGGDLTVALKEGGRGGGSGIRQKLARQALVIAEVALSVTLLIGGGLMIRSFHAMRTQSLGYGSENLLSLRIDYPDRQYPDGPKARALVDRVVAEMRSLPGVQSAAMTTEPPLQTTWTRIFTIEGRPKAIRDMPFVTHIVATPGYFQTLRLPLLQGRDFTGADFDVEVMIVSQSFAQRHWPGESALGKRVRFGPPKNNEPWKTVVGVVADSKQRSLQKGDRAGVYLPYHTQVTPNVVLMRTAGDPLQMARSVRARTASIDGSIAVSRVRTVEQIADQVAWRERFLAVLVACFTIMALALAAVGFYAVLSYVVSLQRHEIGIRMALGASPASVRRIVAGQGMGLAGIGLLLGMGAAFALTRYLKSQLFEISPTDPATWAAALLVFLAVAAVAALQPARRATRVDPMVALRHE